MRPLPTLLASLVAVSLSPFAGRAATNPSVACRGVIAQQGVGLIKTALQVLDACHADRDKGKRTGDCNDLAFADGKGAFAKATSKATSAIDKKCRPDDGVRDNYADRLHVASGLASTVRSRIEASGAALEDDPPFVGDKLRAKCRKAVAKTRSAIVAEIVKRAVRCQKAVDKTAVVFGALQGACVLGPIKTGPKAAATLAKCGALADVSCAPLPGCVVDSATGTGQALAAAIYGGALFASGLESDTSALLIGAAEQPSFRVRLAHPIPGAQIEVDEVDGFGNVLAKLTDLFDDGSGLHNDTTAGDGLFNNTVALQFDTLGDHFYVATLTAGSVHAATPVVRISVKQPPSDAELQQVLDDEAAIRQQAADAVADGEDREAILDALESTLKAPPYDVKPESIDRSDHAIGWENADGIVSIVDLDVLELPVPVTTVASSVRRDGAPADACKRAIAISPFASSFGQFDSAESIASFLEQDFWHVTRITDDHVGVDSFKNLGNQKLIAIASFSDALPQKGVYILTRDPATRTAMALNVADLFNHRLAVAFEAFAILPRFVTRYVGRLQNPIVYVGGGGAADSSMADAFIGQGAAAYLSFTGMPVLEQAQSRALGAIQTLTTPNKTVADIPHIDEGIFKEFGNLGAKLPSSCDALKDNDLLVEYSWPQTQHDLDTNTKFLGDGVGFSCGDGNPYLHWGGDNVSEGGVEFTIVDLFAAHQDGKFGASTTVTAHAGWFSPSDGAGPATLTVALKNKETGETSAVSRKTIQPGTQSGCAATQVATIEVTVAGDPEPVIIYELK